MHETRDESKQTLSEMDQNGRDAIFYGDSIDKKRLRDYQEREKIAKKERRAQRIREHREEIHRRAIEEARMKRGEGSEEKRIRSEAEGKENPVLKPFLRKYQNVDENITTIRSKICPYQLVHEGD